MANILVSAFTHPSVPTGILSEIISDAGASVSSLEITARAIPRALVKKKALWDTGASNCCITAALVQELKLSPVRKVEVHHASLLLGI